MLNIFLRRKQFCQESLRGQYWELCFFICIDDITNSADQLEFYFFADDTHMLYAGENLKSLKTTVNFELSNVYNRLTANKLSLNIKKSVLSFDLGKIN